MLTVIDSLIITLGLDPSNFTKGQKEAAQAFVRTKEEATKAGKDIESAGKGAAASIEKIRNQALALFAVFTGGKSLKSFVDELTRSDSALGKTSQFIGSSVEKLNEWRGMAKLTGGSAESITGSLQALNQALLAMKYTGDTSLLPGLRALQQAAPGADLSFMEMNGRLLKGHELVEKLRGAFKGLDKDTALFIGNQMHLSEDLVYILTLPEDEYKKYRQSLQELSKLTEADTKAARERIRVQNTLEIATNSLGSKIMTVLTPAIVASTEWLTKLLNKLTNSPEVVTQLAVAVGVLAGALTAVQFAPILLAMAKFAALAAAVVAAVKFLQQYKADMDNGWKPGDPVQHSSEYEENFGKGVDERRAAARYLRRLNKQSTLVDTIYYGTKWGKAANEKAVDEDRQAYEKLYGAGTWGRGGIQGSAPRSGDSRSDQKAFIDKYRAIAEEISRETGIPVERILAQAGHESGWRIDAPGNNLFGIKPGSGYTGSTFESVSPEGPNSVPKMTTFRRYGSAEESFRDWAKVLQQSNFRGASAPGLSDAQYAHALKAGGYAEDKDYERKLIGAIGTTRGYLGGGALTPSGPQIAASGGGSTTNSTSVNVNTINVQTQATDSKGIAASIKSELSRIFSSGQANYGVR